MSFFKKLFSKKEEIKQEEITQEEINNVFLVSHLNMRMQPMHRHKIEDMICETFQKKFGSDAVDVVGGGTATAEGTGMPLYCDIEWLVRKDLLNEFLDFLDFSAKFHFFTKGSKTTIFDENNEISRVEPLGNSEGFFITLSNDLDDEVYANNDINELITLLTERIEKDNKGYFTSWFEGAQTTLFFYGNSFDEMKELTADILSSHPLAQKAELEKLA